MRKKETRKRVFKEKRRDEESLYFILERDLDREAIFPSHDGWYSQVSLGKRKRIDYVVKYRDKVYGVEVKKNFPSERHFEQAEKYHDSLNGIFLAYPSDWVGQAIYVSEMKKSKFPDVGLISLTLYSSHVIRKTKQKERQSEQTWKDLLLEDKEYLSRVSQEWTLEQSDRLTSTALKDGCFWVSSNRNHKEREELSALSFSKSDWKGLALLYGAASATSMHRYFSLDSLWRDYCKDLGWKSFNLGKLEFSGLAVSRSYGDLLWMWTLSEASIFFVSKVRDTLRIQLKEREWKNLNQKINEWRREHEDNQNYYEKEFAE